MLQRCCYHQTAQFSVTAVFFNSWHKMNEWSSLEDDKDKRLVWVDEPAMHAFLRPDDLCSLQNCAPATDEKEIVQCFHLVGNTQSNLQTSAPYPEPSKKPNLVLRALLIQSGLRTLGLGCYAHHVFKVKCMKQPGRLQGVLFCPYSCLLHLEYTYNDL